MKKNFFSNKACQVCKSKKIIKYFQNRIGSVYNFCNNCGFIFLDSRQIVSEYPKNALKIKLKFFKYFRDFRGNKNWSYAISYANWINNYIDITRLKKPSVLSVGCAHAFDLLELRNKGWNVLGIDFDNDFALRAKNQFNIDVQISSFEKYKFQSSFNLILFIGVVPYINNIIDAFKKSYLNLYKGGHIAIISRSVDFSRGKEVLSYPTNIHAKQYFSNKSIRILLASLGFDVITIDYFKYKESIVDKIPNRLLEFYLGFGNYKIFPIKELVNIYNFFKLIFRVNVFKSDIAMNSDSIFILAKKIS